MPRRPDPALILAAAAFALAWLIGVKHRIRREELEARVDNLAGDLEATVEEQDDQARGLGQLNAAVEVLERDLDDALVTLVPWYGGGLHDDLITRRDLAERRRAYNIEKAAEAEARAAEVRRWETEADLEWTDATPIPLGADDVAAPMAENTWAAKLSLDGEARVLVLPRNARAAFAEPAEEPELVDRVRSDLAAQVAPARRMTRSLEDLEALVR